MNFRTMLAGSSWTAVTLLSLSSLSSQPALALSAHNVPRGTQIAADRGRVDPNLNQNFTVLLKLHNQADYDAAVAALYNPESSTYQHWFSDADFAKYAPTAAEIEVVKKELVKQGFSVVSTDPQNFSIRVNGSTATAEKAFQTELHNFSYNGKTFQAHIVDAQLTGEAGTLVDSVVGLDRQQVRTLLSVAKDPRTGKPLFQKKVTPADAGSTLLSEITGVALSAPAVSTKSRGQTR